MINDEILAAFTQNMFICLYTELYMAMVLLELSPFLPYFLFLFCIHLD